MTSDRALVDEWIAVHRTLMEREATFKDLAVKAAMGQVAESELAEARAKLLSMREHCNSVYVRAFGGGTSAAPATSLHL